MNEATDHRVLVVDDDPNLNEMLSTALQFAGYSVRSARTAAGAYVELATFRPDVVVLDVNLPDEDGFAVCERMRASDDDTPVIFLTARDDADDVITGLSRGADDYVTKPFQLGELSLRISAILRRTADARPSQLRYDELVVEEDAHRVTWAGEHKKLTPREFAVLRYLLVNRERVLSKAQVAEAVWGAAGAGDDNLVETYVSRLRSKLGEGGRLIETIRGVGYSLRVPAVS